MIISGSAKSAAVDRENSKKRAARTIQRKWRNAFGATNEKNLLFKLLKEKQRKKEIQSRVMDIALYVCFLFCFSASCIYDQMDMEFYYFSHGVIDQLTKVEFQHKDSPSWAKTYYDIVTITEFHQWLEGVFVPDAYLSQGWDKGSGNVPNKGMILGYGKVLGGIRIGQLRSQKTNCNFKTPGRFLNYDNYCFGNKDGEFTVATEEVADFGHSEVFKWEGLNGKVVIQRQPYSMALIV